MDQGRITTTEADWRDEVAFRPGLSADRAYVIRTWLATYARSPLGRALGPVYYTSWGRVVSRRVDDALGGCGRLLIACLASEPDCIVGFGVSREKILDYVCLRDEWRRRGIGKAIAQELTADWPLVGYSHAPPPGIKLPPEWVACDPIGE